MPAWDLSESSPIRSLDQIHRFQKYQGAHDDFPPLYIIDTVSEIGRDDCVRVYVEESRREEKQIKIISKEQLNAFFFCIFGCLFENKQEYFAHKFGLVFSFMYKFNEPITA